MTKEEIESKIAELKESVDDFSEPERTFKLSKINQLEIELQGMALSDIAALMSDIELPEIESMEQHIQAANDATKEQSERVEAFNKAYDLLEGALEIAI